MFYPVEFLEDLGQFLRRDPDPRVRDPDLHEVARHPRTHLHLSTVRGVIDRVGKEIVHDLLDILRVREDRPHMIADPCQADALLFRSGLHQGGRFLNKQAHIGRDQALGQPPSLQPGHIQQIVNQPQQGVDLLDPPSCKVRLLFRKGAGQSFCEHALELAYRHKGAAQFVGHHVHEVRLHPVQFLEYGDVFKGNDRPGNLPEGSPVRLEVGSGNGPEHPVAHSDLLGDEFSLRRFTPLDSFEGLQERTVLDDTAHRNRTFKGVRQSEEPQNGWVVKHDLQLIVGDQDAAGDTVHNSLKSLLLRVQGEKAPDGLLLVEPCLPLQLPFFDRPIHGQDKLFELEGLGKKIIGSLFHAIHGYREGAVAGEDYHGYRRV